MSRLTRSESDRIFSGVCGGIARFVAVEATWVRLAFILLFMASGLGLFLYLLLAILIPADRDASLPAGEVIKNNFDDLAAVIGDHLANLLRAAGESRSTAFLLIVLGLFLLFTQFGWLSNPGWGALILIGFGLYFIYRNRGG